MVDKNELTRILSSLDRARIGVIGDFTLDAYWPLAGGKLELSIETGKPTHAVLGQIYSLGGAGNVVKNLVDLKVGYVSAFGVISSDIFGREMFRQLEELRVDVGGMITQEKDWDTPVYAKPYLGSEEQERIDFGRFNSIDSSSEIELIRLLRDSSSLLDVLIVNQQLPHGIYSENVVKALNDLAVQNTSKTVLLDSRTKTEEFTNMICKVNAAEASRICGEPRELTELVPLDRVKEYALQIFRRTHKPVYITRSGRGLVLYDGIRYSEIPGIQILKKIDPVGAGDTTVSAIAAVLAVGGDYASAGEIGNLAAAVTVQKLQQTGTTSPEEVIQIWDEADYIFNAELADDIRAAKYIDGSEVEVITRGLPHEKIAHAIFDHDGTISTLRQGWESVMESVMVKAILGDRFDSAEEETYNLVITRVREYINQSTGIETIRQMQALAEMVRESGFVPPEYVLDAEGYKEIYNRALMKEVDARIKKLGTGELEVADFSIKGALPFLHELKVRGVKLYLASGTDESDVVREAEQLGYAELFGGRIYGYSKGSSLNTKRRVIREIIDRNRLHGAGLVCFGDGPVELRETKRVGGIAVGVASDEVRRFGLNPLKRSRLLKSGADVIIPDFSQRDILLHFDFLPSVD